MGPPHAWSLGGLSPGRGNLQAVVLCERGAILTLAGRAATCPGARLPIVSQALGVRGLNATSIPVVQYLPMEILPSPGVAPHPRDWHRSSCKSPWFQVVMARRANHLMAL